jgi:hypothetical protein
MLERISVRPDLRTGILLNPTHYTTYAEVKNQLSVVMKRCKFVRKKEVYLRPYNSDVIAPSLQLYHPTLH